MLSLTKESVRGNHSCGTALCDDTKPFLAAMLSRVLVTAVCECVDARVAPADLELALCWCVGGASVDVPQSGHRVQVVGGDEGLGVGILRE